MHVYIYKVNLPAKYMGQKFGEVLLHNYASSGIAHVTAAGYMRLLLYAMCHTCLITSASVSSLSQAADIPTPLRPQEASRACGSVTHHMCSNITAAV